MQSLSHRARRTVRMSVLALVVATASLGASACVPLKGGAPGYADPTMVQLFQLVNAARAAEGLGPLPQCPTLFAAADAHNRDMSARGYFDHISPEGKTPRTVLSHMGTARPSSARTSRSDSRPRSKCSTAG